MLLSFSLMALYHMAMNKIYCVEEAIEFDIEENANFAWSDAFGNKGIDDVNSIADFWSWTRLGFLPLVIQPTWSYSELYADAEEGDQVTADYVPIASKHYPDPVPVRGDYLYHNRVVGGIRFR